MAHSSCYGLAGQRLSVTAFTYRFAMGKRHVWIDALKSVSILAVILLHAAAPLLLAFEHPGGGETWWIGNVYDSAVRWSVPVFVMVSGALLLDRARDDGVFEFLRRRVLRVAIPFLAWSLIYFEWQIAFHGAEQRQAELLPMLLSEPVSYHLWFVYMLLGLYLLAPLLSVLARPERRRLAYYGIGLWLIWAGVLPMLERLLGAETWYSPGRDNSPLMLVGYFLLGYLLKDLVPRPRVAAALALCYLLAVALTAVLTFVLTRAAQGELEPLFYEYYSLNVAFMATAIFLLGATTARRDSGDSRIARLWQFLSPRVFGVYLVHVLVLDLLKEGTLGFTLDHGTGHAAIAVPGLAVAAFLISLAFVLVLERIPLIRRVLV